MNTLALVAFLAAAIPAVLFLVNLCLYRRPAPHSVAECVSVLIPARNEETSIGHCLRSVLKTTDVQFELIVLDDHSTDATAAIVREIASVDARVRLESAPPLPAGWCGKQFACYQLALLAQYPVLCFLDADVHLAPDALRALASELRRSRAALISGFPHQIVLSPFEQLLLPLMHFLLLGFLPLARMRCSVSPAYSAGCGQLLVADRASYFRCGGHAHIRDSRHDGIALPRVFRRAGFMTDLCDVTEVAFCRMYRNASEVFAGLLKNATEGLADRRRILPCSLLLICGQVLPLVLLCTRGGWLSYIALGCAYVPRFAAAVRFRQPLLAALLHPIAILILLGIQFVALGREMLGRPAVWKGRAYPA